MAEINFSLAELFEQTFGYRTQAFEPQFATTGDGSLSGRKEQGKSGSPFYATDAMGREYYMPITITYQDNAVNNSNIESPGILKKWDLPYPIISISGRKTIIETPLTERRGTVKELINIQDYEIVVKGFVISRTNEFPENDVATLLTIYEQNTPVSISCPLTDIFLLRSGRSGSDSVVITDLRLPPMEGIKNVRPYELRMVSDAPFSLISIQ
jgi:hypothetical protein